MSKARLVPASSNSACPVLGRVEVDDGREGLVVDDHRLGRVDALGPGLADHRRHRLPDEANLVLGQPGSDHGRIEHRHRRRDRRQVHVGAGDHGNDAGHRLGLLDVDARDAAMGDGGADVGDVCRPVVVHVVHVGAAGSQELRIFATQNPVAEDAHGCDATPSSQN